MKYAVFLTIILICHIQSSLQYVVAPVDFDLELVIELTRHGERASRKIFNITEGPNFEVKEMELTYTGAESHHAVGHALGDEFDFARLLDTRNY